MVASQQYHLASEIYNFTFKDYLEEPIEIFEAATIDRKIIVFIIFFVSLALNIVLVIQQIYAYRVQNQYNNKFVLIIINFAVSSILVSSFCALKGFVWMVTYYWFAGNAACKLLMYLRTFTLYLNSFSVVMILMASVVAKKIHKLNSAVMVLVFICPAWVCSALFSIPEAVVFEAHKVSEDIYQCYVAGKYHTWAINIQWYLFTPIAFLVPMFLSILLTGILALDGLKRKTRRNAASTVTNTYELMTAENEQEMSADDVTLTTPTTKPKMDYLPIIICVIYFGCWMPYIVGDILISVLQSVGGVTFYFWAFYIGVASTMFTAVVIVMDSFIGLC